MNVYKVRVPYGRGEMTGKFLVGAKSSIKAKRLANAACPCTAPLHAIECWLLDDVRFLGKVAAVVSKI